MPLPPDYHYEQDPDDRPTLAECEAEEYDDDDPGRCIICDGVGHAYIVGWHEVPGKGMQPIIGGGPCPLEEPGGWQPEEDDNPF
jgi:hypothetical protein